MALADLVSVLLLGAYAVLVVLDFSTSARRHPRLGLWRLKGFGFFVLNIGLFSTLPFLWDEWLGAHRLIDATALGAGLGALVALLVQQLFSYAWHRGMHNSKLLWRYFHQMHHSAERVDIFGAMYFSPLDVVGFSFIGSLAMVWLVGVSPEAAVVANGIATFAALFQHANLRTPQWLGYLVHRPENHALHHARGVHAYNYGDFALWDMVFGTFRNPAEVDAEAGFYDGASQRVGAMLIGKDVSTAPTASGPLPERPSVALA